MSIAARQMETDECLRLPTSAATLRGFLAGSPDMVLEIVSRSSVRKDTRDLRAAYHRAKVREYWLASAMGKTIDFEILLYRPRGYVASPLRSGWRRSAVFGHRFRLTRRRDPVGLWQYRLDVEQA